MSISMRQLKLDMDECSGDQPISMAALWTLHRMVGGEPKASSLKSLNYLGHRHSNVFRFLWFNTYLMPDVTISIGLDIKKVVGAPLNRVRAAEIGDVCSHGYDCIALAEVWLNEERDIILESMNPSWPQWASGPGRGSLVLGSGLLTINRGSYPRIGDVREAFNVRGDLTIDADAWSNKGVLLVVVETGFKTKLEIYSTHLIYGGGIRDASPHDTYLHQREQIDQLISFIKRTHLSSNYIIIAGDFNIDQGDQDENTADENLAYGYLVQQMRYDSGLELEDVWIDYALLVYGARKGQTNSPYYCRKDNHFECRRFADDTGKLWDSRGRIDYVFIQRPNEAHDINIDIGRPRRRHFPRDPSDPGWDANIKETRNLSDHLGIDLKLFISSK